MSAMSPFVDCSLQPESTATRIIAQQSAHPRCRLITQLASNELHLAVRLAPARETHAPVALLLETLSKLPRSEEPRLNLPLCEYSPDRDPLPD